MRLTTIPRTAGRSNDEPGGSDRSDHGRIRPPKQARGSTVTLRPPRQRMDVLEACRRTGSYVMRVRSGGTRAPRGVDDLIPEAFTPGDRLGRGSNEFSGSDGMAESPLPPSTHWASRDYDRSREGRPGIGLARRQSF